MNLCQINKTYTERDYQHAHYFGIENEVETVFNNAETNIFRWDMLFLAVPAGSVSRCFVT